MVIQVGTPLPGGLELIGASGEAFCLEEMPSALGILLFRGTW